MAEATTIPMKDGGPITWEELFPPDAPAAGSQAQTTAEGGTVATQPVTPPIPFELRTKTGTVYNSIEDAAKGIEHKDALIEQLRQRYILERGIDPISGQPVRMEPAPQNANYMADPARYVDDLTSAAQKGDRQAIWQAQTKLVFDAIAPAIPMMTSFARQQAIDSVSSEIKDFKEFYGSDYYQKALEDSPDLKDAISRAEGNIEHSPRLAGLYKVAYRVSQGLRLPEILKAQPATTTAQPVRQTTAPNTLEPAQAAAQSASIQTKEGRRAVIERFEAQGFADKPLV